MRCKACSKVLSGESKMKMFDERSEEINQEENLCNVCLSVAESCYTGYNIEPEQRDMLLREWCLSEDFGDLSEHIDHHGCIGTEEL